MAYPSKLIVALARLYAELFRPGRVHCEVNYAGLTKYSLSQRILIACCLLRIMSQLLLEESHRTMIHIILIIFLDNAAY